MKKWMLLLVAGVMALVLAACNETAEPTEGASKEKESDLKAEEVYTKALEVSEEMESAEISMNMKQKMESEAESVAMNTESSFDMEMTMNPIAMHQKGTTKMTMEGSEEEIPEMDMETYMVDGEMYLYNEQVGNWLKMDGAMMDAVNAMSGQPAGPDRAVENAKGLHR